MPAPQYLASSYPENAVQTGIVHLGLGAFHRAHQAVFLERYLARNNGGPWGIAAANLRSNKAIVESLERAGYCYHVAEYASRDDVALRAIRAIRKALFAGEDVQPLLRLMAAPEVRIVTLTVTEKGYYIGADGHLLADDPAIRRDLEHPETPATPIGVLVRALEKRMQAGLAPFAVISCDNLPENGRRTRKAVLSFAALRNDALAAWIEAHTPFPSSMVDRIVPAVTESSLADVAALLGRRDENAITAEAFIQWVVEDFGPERPDWEPDGVQMTHDVRPYEGMKLRLLNGSHSLLAYAGGMAGKETIVDCMREPLLEQLVARYLATEAGPSLRDVPEATWKEAADNIVRRFKNDSLAHKTNQIAMDGSQKIPQRWLHGTLERIQSGHACPCTALGLAAWLFHMRETDAAGRAFPMRDPRREPLLHNLQPLHTDQPDRTVEALFAERDLIPAELAAATGYVDQVKAMYRLMLAEGSLAAVRATVQAS